MEATKDFLTQEDRDAIKFLSMKSKFDEGEKARKMIDAQSKVMLDNEEETAILDAKLAEITEDDIKKLSNEELNEIFMVGLDDEIKLNSTALNDDVELKRDFLIFRKKSIETFAYIDAETKKLNEELSEYKEEFDRIVSKFDTFNDVIMERLNTLLETVTDEIEIARIKAIIKQIEYGYSLDNVKEYYSNDFKRRQIFGIYGIDAKTRKMFSKYEKVINHFGINESLLKFGNIEEALFGKGYTAHPNIFVIAIMIYISEMKVSDDDKIEGVFISQFISNMKDMLYGKMKEDKKTTFVNNIKEIIDMIEK